MRCLPQLTALLALCVAASAGAGCDSTHISSTAAALISPAAETTQYPTPEPVAAQLEPRTQAFIDALQAAGGPPLYTLPVQTARTFLDVYQSGNTSRPPADVQDQVIPVGPTGSVSIRIVKPKGSSGYLPIIVYIHGGGWILGDEKTHDRLIREIASGAQAAVVFVKYSPSPEAQFPVPLEQCYAATKYIAEHGASFGLDPTRLAIAGDSVGGNMATVVARLAKERGGPVIRYQALFYPVTDATFDTPSYQQFVGGPWLTKRAMQWFFDAYAPKLEDREKPEVSPLRASVEQLRNLPPALVITDENDVLRDEGEAYAHSLMRAGVPVKAVRVLGTIHDFMMLDALASTPPTRSAITLASAELRDALVR
jgi:acetyl esterase